jgi:hypothetical protein
LKGRSTRANTKSVLAQEIVQNPAATGRSALVPVPGIKEKAIRGVLPVMVMNQNPKVVLAPVGREANDQYLKTTLVQGLVQEAGPSTGVRNRLKGHIRQAAAAALLI